MANNISNNSFIPDDQDALFNMTNIIGTVIFLENLIAVVILLRSVKLPFTVRILSKYLAVSDCVLGIGLTIPTWVYAYVLRCNMRMYVVTTSYFSSFFVATVINVNHCLAIFSPMRYTTIVTRRRLHAICIILSTLSPLLAYLSFNDFDTTSDELYCGKGSVERKPTVRLFGKVQFGFNVILYLGIIIELCKNRLNVFTKGARGRIVEEGKKTVRKFSLISGFLFVCYTPTFIVRELQIDILIPNETQRKMLIFLCEILLLLNSFVNPILYVMRFYEARFQFFRLVCFWNSRMMERKRRDRLQHFATFNIRMADRGQGIYDKRNTNHAKSSETTDHVQNIVISIIDEEQSSIRRFQTTNNMP